MSAARVVLLLLMTATLSCGDCGAAGVTITATDDLVCCTGASLVGASTETMREHTGPRIQR